MEYDVIIVGGSYAGLSAAMALGRSLRKVLIIDSGLPCNRQTPHSHNFITQDGEKPGIIADIARAQVLQYYTVKIINDLAVSASKIESDFEVTTQDGTRLRARKLIFATGIQDSMPPIKGFAECWGISVVHCPYCHGYELRNVRTGIIANGERAIHLASLVHNLTREVTVLTSGKSELTSEQVAKLAEHNIGIVETAISEIEHRQGHVQSVVFKDGNKTAFEAVYAAIPFTQHSDIPVALGCELTDQGYVKVDASQKTTVDGIFACGDNSSMMRSVANAVYTGNITGAMVNRELTLENF